MLSSTDDLVPQYNNSAGTNQKNGVARGGSGQVCSSPDPMDPSTVIPIALESRLFSEEFLFLLARAELGAGSTAP